MAEPSGPGNDASAGKKRSGVDSTSEAGETVAKRRRRWISLGTIAALVGIAGFFLVKDRIFPPDEDGEIPAFEGDASHLADAQTDTNPEPEWQMTDAWRCSHCANKGGDPAQDPYIIERATGGSPWPVARDANGKPVSNPAWREFRTDPDKQSIYDAGVGGPSTRTSLIKGYRYQPGTTTVTYLDVRLHRAGFPEDRGLCNGLTDCSQVFQLKDWDADGVPILLVGRSGLQFTLSHTGVEHHFPADDDKWYRIAVEMRVGADSYAQLWTDMDRNGTMERNGPRYETPIPARNMWFCIGPYHRWDANFPQGVRVDLANPAVFASVPAVGVRRPALRVRGDPGLPQ